MLKWIPWFRDWDFRNYPPLDYITFEIRDETVILYQGVLKVSVVAKNSTHFPVHVERVALIVSHHATGHWVQIDTGDMGVLTSGKGVGITIAVPLPWPWMQRVGEQPSGYTEDVNVMVTGVRYGAPYSRVMTPPNGLAIRHVKLRKDA